MAHSMRQKRINLLPSNSWLLAAVFATLFVASARGQQPQFNQGFSRSGQATPTNPAESSAYSAAISQSDPAARASAIQQFLIQHPNSPLRQPAMAQMMLAKRSAGAAGPSPNGSMGQPMNQPLAQPIGAPAAAPANTPVLVAQPEGPPRDSLLQHPAQPAQVAVSPGSLTIKADNSSLSQILQEISKSTGMKVDGLSKDDRIFGDYGPGDPREVLLSLLQGSGYNVLMIGNDKGTPRQLSLSQRSAGSAVASAANANNNHQEEDEEIEQEQPQVPPEPPQQQNQPPQGNPGQPRNPAEIQQELIRLHQQQQQQQTPPQQQPQQ